MKLVKNIVYQARRHELQPAIAFPGGVANYRVLMNSVSAAVEVLRTLQLPANALVILDIRNPVYHTAMFLALALLGYPSASVGTAYSTTSSGPRPHLLLTDRDDIDAAGLTWRKVDPRWFSFPMDQPVDYAGLLALPGFADPSEVVRYVYSSGTTGRAKCVAFTAECLDRRVSNYALFASRRDTEGSLLNMMGYSTINGTMVPLWLLASGATLCFASSYQDALQLIHLFNVSTLTVAVIQLQGLIEALGDQPSPKSLRTIGVGGSKLPARLLSQARERLCSNLMSGYGSTEMGVISTSTAAELARHEGAVGYVVPWVQVEVVDDNGIPVPVGHEGTLRFKSDEQAFYVDDVGEPAPTLVDGWFYPGDVGRLAPDGQLIVTGRTSEIINRGGVIVAPEAVEEVLRLDAAVADVAVVGFTNADGIEEIWAAVITAGKVDAESLIAKARPRLNEKVPDRVFQVDSIPRNENGKVMRNLLRETLRTRLAAGSAQLARTNGNGGR